MHHRFKLKSMVWHKPDIEFDIDTETGKIDGKHAVLVSSLAAAALKDGSVVSHPYPTVYEVKDPLHNLSDLAAVLSECWILDDELFKVMPKHDEVEESPNTITDADGQEIVIPWIY